MFFLLSKILGFFALPSNLAATIVAIGVVLLFTRRRVAGRRLAALGVVLLLVAGFSPLGNALIYGLEQRFPPWDAARGAPDGIVVLGGSVDADLSAARGIAVVRAAPPRGVAAGGPARRYPNARVIFSGGSGNLLSNDAREADYAASIFESLGIAKERLTM